MYDCINGVSLDRFITVHDPYVKLPFVLILVHLKFLKTGGQHITC